ncbi:palmitoyltransferase ZDHHC5-A-like [Clupea harengus]|uniref:Palmitoyltransferase ZDHHC5-A-like n=1 Tax=Clupea harengus TaxID=7950 RepID=A0A8M1KHA1_CLUHA|nr:palmitoyltransferase ZDHHC5-A-like [Clupea harengus]
MHRSKSSLEMMESQSADAEPPPPPKPELRYPGLSRGPGSHSEESSLLNKAPPTPTMYKYRPPYSSPGKNHTALTHAYANQMSRGDSLKESSTLLQSSQQPGYRSEPSLDGGVGERGGCSERSVGSGGGAVGSGIPGYSLGGRSYPSFSDATVLSGGGPSRSSSSVRSGQVGAAAAASEATTSASYKSLANQTPPLPVPRNGSLSYDSLLTPSESPDLEPSSMAAATSGGATSELSPGRTRNPVALGYSSPFLSAQIAQQREMELHQPSGLLGSPHRNAYLRAASSSPPPHAPPPPDQHPHHHHHHSHHHHAQPALPPSSSTSSTAASSASSSSAPHHHHHHHHSHHHHHAQRAPRFSRPPLLSDSGPPPAYPYRTRSTEAPPTTHPPRSPHPPPLGKSLSYSSAAAAEMQYRMVRKASASAGGVGAGGGSGVGGIQAPKDEIQMKSYSRTNGQPKSSFSQSPASSTPSSPSHPISVSTRPGQAYPSTAATQSPAHKPGGGVKKVTGVGGTTYEISV